MFNTRNLTFFHVPCHPAFHQLELSLSPPVLELQTELRRSGVPSAAAAEEIPEPLEVSLVCPAFCSATGLTWL